MGISQLGNHPGDFVDIYLEGIIIEHGILHTFGTAINSLWFPRKCKGVVVCLQQMSSMYPVG